MRDEGWVREGSVIPSSGTAIAMIVLPKVTTPAQPESPLILAAACSSTTGTSAVQGDAGIREQPDHYGGATVEKVVTRRAKYIAESIHELE